MIKRSGKGFVVVSHTGKPLSKTLATRAAAEKRLAQVEMFKHMKGKK